MLGFRAQQGELPYLGGTCSPGVEPQSELQYREGLVSPPQAVLHSCGLIFFPEQPGKDGLCFHGSDTSLNIDLGKGTWRTFVLDP